ncbi:unnamed protein product [marine sediment metagenome]|uniref:Uncharacterized protein n=1 Tax=marine sediment metagenome TaxID=412755 RepID=X0TVI6_9ZZZZ
MIPSPHINSNDLNKTRMIEKVENIILAWLKSDNENLTLPASEICDLFNVSDWYHCQDDEEGGSMCKEQCDHCRNYYSGTDNGR